VQYVVPHGEAKSKAAELAAKVSAMAPLTILGVLHALPRIQDMSEADGLFVESLMIAFTHTGPEAAARLSEFTTKRAPKVAPPSLASTVSSLPADGFGTAAAAPNGAAVNSCLAGQEIYAEDSR